MRETLRGLGQLPGLACPRFADVRQHFVFFARLNAMSRKHLLVIGLAFSLAMIGCGGASSSSNGGGNSVAISVKLSTAPPTSLQTGATATIAATVSNCERCHYDLHRTRECAAGRHGHHHCNLRLRQHQDRERLGQRNRLDLCFLEYGSPILAADRRNRHDCGDGLERFRK